MTMIKKLLTTSAVAAVAMLAASHANAAVFNPYNAAGSTEIIASVTGGYTASWWVEDGSGPANSSGAVVESFTETLTGLSLTGANNAECTGSSREGLGGLSGENDKCSGNVFTVKLNDDSYAVFVYAIALPLNAFTIALDSIAGGGLSHMDVYNSGTGPSPVPVPAGFILLASGLAGLGAVARKRRKA
jgi:hypothetical protein